MNTEEGTITKVSGEKAWVQVKRTAMCDGCHSKRSCFTLSDDKEIESEALNTAMAKVGDRVLIRIESGSLLKISFLFYIVPVLGLILGSLVGMKIAPEFKLDPEIGAVGFSILSIFISYFVIKFFAQRLKEKRDFIPEVVRILPSDKKMECSENVTTTSG